MKAWLSDQHREEEIFRVQVFVTRTSLSMGKFSPVLVDCSWQGNPMCGGGRGRGREELWFTQRSQTLASWEQVRVSKNQKTRLSQEVDNNKTEPRETVDIEFGWRSCVKSVWRCSHECWSHLVPEAWILFMCTRILKEQVSHVPHNSQNSNQDTNVNKNTLSECYRAVKSNHKWRWTSAHVDIFHMCSSQLTALRLSPTLTQLRGKLKPKTTKYFKCDI